MSKKTMLIADDEPVVRNLACRMPDKDYDVIEAQNGREAVSMACSRRPDITFMDVMVLEVNGLSACCAIKTNETTKEIPIVVLTAIGYDPGKKLSEDLWAPTAT